MRYSQRGFTLLELLIVIAIIAILSAIAFSYAGQSRNKSGDAAVKQNLVNARSKAALFFLENGNSYTNLCTNTNIRAIVQSAARASGITPQVAAYVNTDLGDDNEEACHALGAQYAVWVPLKDSTAAIPTGWCIDSTNTSTRKVGVTLGSGAYTCP